jgi:hypothetical protein
MLADLSARNAWGERIGVAAAGARRWLEKPSAS